MRHVRKSQPERAGTHVPHEILVRKPLPVEPFRTCRVPPGALHARSTPAKILTGRQEPAIIASGRPWRSVGAAPTECRYRVPGAHAYHTRARRMGMMSMLSRIIRAGSSSSGGRLRHVADCTLQLQAPGLHARVGWGFSHVSRALPTSLRRCHNRKTENGRAHARQAASSMSGPRGPVGKGGAEVSAAARCPRRDARPKPTSTAIRGVAGKASSIARRWRPESGRPADHRLNQIRVLQRDSRLLAWTSTRDRCCRRRVGPRLDNIDDVLSISPTLLERSFSPPRDQPARLAIRDHARHPDVIYLPQPGRTSGCTRTCRGTRAARSFATTSRRRRVCP